MRFITFSIFFAINAVVTNSSQLDTMLMLGDSAILMEWTPDSINTRAGWYVQYGSNCDAMYLHCDFLPGVTYRSIAYSYGGKDIYIEFRNKISNGFLIGSHMCHYNNFRDDVSKVIAGTDCSGFVCRLWGVPRVATSKLYSQYKDIARDELDVGDILVKPASHVVLIVEKEEDNRFLIWESTSAVNGCRERVIDIHDSIWNEYYPRRYEKLKDQTDAISQAKEFPKYPRIICRNNLISIQSTQQWHGTVEFFSLFGQKIMKIECHFEGPYVSTLYSRDITGIAIARFRSTRGEVKNISLLKSP